MLVDPVQQDHIVRRPFEFSFGHHWPSEERANARSDGADGRLSAARITSTKGDIPDLGAKVRDRPIVLKKSGLKPLE
jgi:hypothetical protein